MSTFVNNHILNSNMISHIAEVITKIRVEFPCILVAYIFGSQMR